MITLRRSEERGHFDHGWLNTYHTFSFADYYDPKHVQFRALRVINEDVVAPGRGFGMHPHRDMEIITYVLDGALAHKDSLGTGSIIKPGDGQRMSAGSGIVHSEFNPSETDSVHLLQIWIMPDERGVEPSYEQKEFPADEKRNRWRLIASKGGEQGSVKIHAGTKLYVSNIEEGQSVPFTLDEKRHAWVQVAKGSIKLNGTELKQGDGAGVSKERELKIEATKDAEVLLFDLD